MSSPFTIASEKHSSLWRVQLCVGLYIKQKSVSLFNRAHY